MPRARLNKNTTAVNPSALAESLAQVDFGRRFLASHLGPVQSRKQHDFLLMAVYVALESQLDPEGTRQPLADAPAEKQRYIGFITGLTRHYIVAADALSVEAIQELHRNLHPPDMQTSLHNGDGTFETIAVNPGKFRERDIGVQQHGPLHAFVPWEQIPEQLQSIVARYNDHTGHPCRAAMEFMLEFNRVHPFLDGNGKLMRVLLDALFIRAGHFPTLMNRHYRDHRDEWLIPKRQWLDGDRQQALASCLEKVVAIYQDYRF